MYSKLAFRNVKKSYRDYSIYFITLMFSVALFYVFNSFEQQSTILKMNEMQGSMVKLLVNVMNVMSVIVAAVFGFLILYANNFLIKRRKKELGLYTLLGMPKRKISTILILETMYIGFFSLLAGLVFGFIASQGTAVLTGKMMAADMNYGFVFSLEATLKTIAIFLGVFLVVVLFNRILLEKYELIELLRADRINEENFVKRAWMSVVIFIVGAGLLVYAYNWALQPMQLFMQLLPIIALGSFATFLIFKSFSGFLLKFMQTSKKNYYKGLNVFVWRQVSAKINSTYKMMSVISIMLLFGMGTLITGFNLNSVMSEQIAGMISNDITVRYSYPIDSNTIGPNLINLKDSRIKNAETMTYYSSVNMRFDDVFEKYIDQSDANSFMFGITDVGFVSVDSINKARAMQKLDKITIDQNQFAVIAPIQQLGPETVSPSNVFKDDDSYAFANQNLSYKKIQDIEKTKFDNNGNDDVLIIVNENTLQNIKNTNDELTSAVTIHMISTQSSKDDKEFARELKEVIEPHYNSNVEGEDMFDYMYFVTSSQELIESSMAMGLLLTYLSFYLGVVFLVTSFVILALQQLSEANDNQKRYQILAKLGVEDRMIDRSIFMQNAIYFFIPLIVALLHTYIGVSAVNVNLKLISLSASSIMPALITLGFVLIVYAIYFIITYQGSKAIIKNKMTK
ncbi:ABC transporter permease [Erysipelothrix aquatica]|uniref:ABC transporter permease n=1 Tax=Erysipelothrix aquatica TaxID=2683714 RepID=UPI001357D163|nr:ABC transporter permease [Erysipelothrix aquatica]